jgi:hypothetical protein
MEFEGTNFPKGDVEAIAIASAIYFTTVVNWTYVFMHKNIHCISRT